MRRVSTRELVHHSKHIQAGLARGESFEWTSRGKVIGIIQPAGTGAGTAGRPDWLTRARNAGAVAPQGTSIADALYEDRD